MKKNEDNVWTQAAAQFQENLNQSWTQALANFQGMGATASPDTSHPALHFSTEKLESLRESYLKDATALMAENWISGKMELQ
ncbi:MAG: class I poly(R)-hydroxyalkanoic acid synthase, partial [Burkholderiaceae bacterium]|nr:class I poly(R)-hydroxyalkanoic acid synthase [Burkholderiaceae bacterium]